ncbi:porin, partial [Sinorhizobium meliloti]|nr:porin [Sinorhizobium meliloti]
MNIKSLLLGSAAALAAVSGAQAADAIVAAEPEPMEYVRVCDAFGTGYFYIPGTETCLKISGFIRVQGEFGPDEADDRWNQEDFGGQSTSDWDMFSR